MRYKVEIWEYKNNQEEINDVIDLWVKFFKSKKRMVVVMDEEGAGLVIVGDNARSEKEAMKIVEALNNAS